MKLPENLIEAIWVRRYKRFLLDAELADGSVVTAHCPNPGSMLGCRGEGNRVMLSHHPGPRRKLNYGLELIRIGRVWVGVNTMLTNRIVEEALRERRIKEFADYSEIRREVTHGKSRFDFELTNKKGRMLLEVKNVTLVEGGAAMFPDSVTTRGARHVDELAEIAASGEKAAIFFCVQRSDVTSFRPAEQIDPAFAAALVRAKAAGVIIVAYKCKVSTKRIVVAEQIKTFIKERE